MYSSSHQGILPFGPSGSKFDELTVKYHEPENSEFWDFYQDGKITTIFCLFVYKMPLKLYIYFILCMLIYLVFNNLTIIFQVPRLLLWQFPGTPSRIPHHLVQHRTSLPQIWDGFCDLSVIIYCLSTFLKIFHDQSATGGVLYSQDVGVNVARSTLWVGLQSCLGDFVYLLCSESPRCWC